MPTSLTESIGVSSPDAVLPRSSHMTAYCVGTLPATPDGFRVDVDGNLWVTEGWVNNVVGRITPDGKLTEFPIPFTAAAIAAGPDGNLWFTEADGNRIGRITPAGVVTEFSAGLSTDSEPNGIAAGPDGNVWFTEVVTGRIGRISLAFESGQRFDGDRRTAVRRGLVRGDRFVEPRDRSPLVEERRARAVDLALQRRSIGLF